jgi:hypothetical protein
MESGSAVGYLALARIRLAGCAKFGIVLERQEA